MRAYVQKRFLAFIPTVILVSLIAFTLLRIIPGDPAVARLLGPTDDADYTKEDLKELQAKLGTDRSLLIQYFECWETCSGATLDSHCSMTAISIRKWPGGCL